VCETESAASKALRGVLQQYQACIVESYEGRADKPPRDGDADSLDNRRYSLAQRQAFHREMQAAVERGDTATFKDRLGKAVLKDCFQCASHAKWHTEHVHCTMHCGGKH